MNRATPNDLAVFWALDDAGLTATRFRLAVRIYRRYNAQRGCDESIPRMAKACGMKADTARVAKRELVARGIVAVTERDGKTDRLDVLAADGWILGPLPKEGTTTPPVSGDLPPMGTPHPGEGTTPPNGEGTTPPNGEDTPPPRGETKCTPEVNTGSEHVSEPGAGASTRPSAKKPKPEDADLPDGIPRAAWADWIAYLRERKKTPTATTVARQISKLERLHADGHDPADLIDTAITAGWQSFHAPKRGRGGRPPREPALSAAAVSAGADLDALVRR